ncbi:universal stress protein [uncultured Microbulbifer sp.]|mgnify:CR=1 FL=1|uniref:universal stress protein n=1 Tax=uncultured Microbulbifer sp. TaxID=348147 RepID=UPI0025F50284|nr:universal stress protein [uncultured Microbulbifer sp.]
MQNILVILDKPKHEQIALQRALELAEKTAINLHLVSFVYEPVIGLPVLAGSLLDLSEQLQKERANWLQELGQEYSLPEQTTTEVVWHHDIPTWVGDYLTTKPCDLVLKTAQKQFGRGGFGSIDWRLIEQTSVPLWIAVNTHWIKRDRMVAALDPALDNKLHVALNHRLLQQGGALAQRLDAELELVACMPIPEMMVESAAFREQLDGLKDLLKNMIDESGASSRQTHFVVGKPAAEINRLVDRTKARMIMVGRGVRRGPRGFVLGNTAERILGRSNTDVLIVP